MVAGFAVLLLAETVATCVPTPRFAGGATVVRPVGNAEPLPIKPLGPATAIEKDKAIEQTGADAPEKDASPAQASEPCEAPTHIV